MLIANRTAATLAWAGALLALVLSGCGTSGPARLSAREFAAVEGLPLQMAGERLESTGDIIAEVTGESCNDTGYGADHPRARPVSRYEALYRLRLAAMDRDADRVVRVHCETQQGGSFSRCSESMTCTGVAMRDGAAGSAAQPAGSVAVASGAAAGSAPARQMEFVVPEGFTPDYLTERQRADLGRLAIGMPSRTPGSRVEAPLSPNQAAAAGAGQWIMNCIGQGGQLGLIASPACAVIGAVLGATSAADPQQVEGTAGRIVAALESFYSHEALRDEVVRVSRATTDGDFQTIDTSARRALPEVDTVLEVGVEELLLPVAGQGATTNLPSSIIVRARARVVERDGAVLFDRAYGFTSEAREFARWGAENGAAVRLELYRGYRHIAERIVDDVLLTYPVMPVFGPDSDWQDGYARRYLIEPRTPGIHAFDYRGRVFPDETRTLTPTFSWQPFPAAAVLEADFQGRLGSASNLRYDLRVYRVQQSRPGARLVLESQDLKEPSYTPTQPLAPDSLYIWSVRARFRLDGQERTTRWAGDWLGGRAKGFAFFTPR